MWRQIGIRYVQRRVLVRNIQSSSPLLTRLNRLVITRRKHEAPALGQASWRNWARFQHQAFLRRRLTTEHGGHRTNVCWKCGQAIVEGSLFCGNPECSSILDPDNSKDVDFFELLSVEKRYDLDVRQLEKLFWKLQMNLHPDKFQTASALEREYSETVSTRVNDAYAVLKTPLSRAEYMLKLAGKDPFAEDLDAPKMNEAFLFEMMEAREEIEMTSDVEALQKLKIDYEGKVGSLVDKKLEQAFRENRVDEAFDLTVTLRYLTRIVEELREKLANS